MTHCLLTLTLVLALSALTHPLVFSFLIYIGLELSAHLICFGMEERVFNVYWFGSERFALELNTHLLCTGLERARIVFLHRKSSTQLQAGGVLSRGTNAGAKATSLQHWLTKGCSVADAYRMIRCSRVRRLIRTCLPIDVSEGTRITSSFSLVEVACVLSTSKVRLRFTHIFFFLKNEKLVAIPTN